MTEKEREILATRIRLDLFILLQENSEIFTANDLLDVEDGLSAKELLARMLNIDNQLFRGHFTWDSYLQDAMEEFPEYLQLVFDASTITPITYSCNICGFRGREDKFSSEENEETDELMIKCPNCNSLAIEKE